MNRIFHIQHINYLSIDESIEVTNGDSELYRHLENSLFDSLNFYYSFFVNHVLLSIFVYCISTKICQICNPLHIPVPFF